jgi:hypothetical protein
MWVSLQVLEDLRHLPDLDLDLLDILLPLLDHGVRVLKLAFNVDLLLLLTRSEIYV